MCIRDRVYTPRTKKVLEQSVREARELNQNYVSTEHILLALMREREGVAAHVLIKMGVDLSRAREEDVYKRQELGRVVIPKEIRRTLRIREGDPLEIFTDHDGEVVLKKYSPSGEISAIAKDYTDSVSYTHLDVYKRQVLEKS